MYEVNGKLMSTLCADDTTGILLDNILRIMSQETFSKDKAAYIVGGRTRLTRLISEGKIEVTKPSGAQNGKWYCNAGQVLAHCRPFFKVKPKKQKR